MRSPAELTTEFRSMGLKVTPQRQLLFRLLYNNTSHPSADALFAAASAQMPGISLRTVYQTITDLANMGELQSFSFGGGATRFDPNVGEHHHRVCTACSTIADVYIDAAEHLHEDIDVESGLQGFSVASTDIVFRGLCSNCISAGNHMPAPPTLADLPSRSSDSTNPDTSTRTQ